VSKPPRIDRKTLKNPDEFVTKGRATLDFFVRQQNRFIPVLIVVILAVAATYGYDYYNRQKQDKGWEAYAAALKLPEAERWEKLKTLHAELKSGRPAFFAAVGIADHYFDEAKKELAKAPPGTPEGKPASAAISAEWYSRAAAEPSLLPAEQQLLHINRGGALEIAGQWDEAQQAYQRGADLAGDSKGLALLGVGRVHEAKGEAPKALEVYEKVAQDFSANEYGKMAKGSVRRMKSPLFEGPKS